MRFALSVTLTLPLLLTTAGMAVLPTSSAFALPTQTVCLVTTYFNNAAHDQEVGTRTKCTGSAAQTHGRVTPYHITEREVLDNGGGGHTGGGPGSLPCEFLQEGCSNLPVTRF